MAINLEFVANIQFVPLNRLLKYFVIIITSNYELMSPCDFLHGRNEDLEG